MKKDTKVWMFRSHAQQSSPAEILQNTSPAVILLITMVRHGIETSRLLYLFLLSNKWTYPHLNVYLLKSVRSFETIDPFITDLDLFDLFNHFDHYSGGCIYLCCFGFDANTKMIN